MILEVIEGDRSRYVTDMSRLVVRGDLRVRARRYTRLSRGAVVQALLKQSPLAGRVALPHPSDMPQPQPHQPLLLRARTPTKTKTRAFTRNRLPNGRARRLQRSQDETASTAINFLDFFSGGFPLVPLTSLPWNFCCKLDKLYI